MLIRGLKPNRRTLRNPWLVSPGSEDTLSAYRRCSSSITLVTLMRRASCSNPSPCPRRLLQQPILAILGIGALVSLLAGSSLSAQSNPGERPRPSVASERPSAPQRPRVNPEERRPPSSEVGAAQTRPIEREPRGASLAERRAFWQRRLREAQFRLEEWYQRRLVRLTEIRNVASSRRDTEALQRLDRLEERLEAIHSRRMTTLETARGRLVDA